MAGMAFERDKLIRFHHCDPAAIVFYPQYFILFNELLEDWFKDGLGVDYAHFLLEHRLGTPVVRLECEFLAPSEIGDTLRLSLRVKRIGTTSLTLALEAGCRGEKRVQATQVIVLASLDTKKPIPVPPELRGKIERFVVG
jgi:4-hydroxybenzoyl-CoA thioesterase